jgi:hypothetical protein
MIRKVKEQLSALTSSCFHDWLLELDEEQFRAELIRFNQVSGGVLDAAQNIFMLKQQMKSEQKKGNQ